MIANAIESFDTEIERLEYDIGTPHSVVVTARYERIEGIFAGVPTRSMAAIVAECDGFGQRNVEAKAT